MAMQKRRVIYLSDEVWAEAESQAHAAQTTVSARVRALIASASGDPALPPIPFGIQRTIVTTGRERVIRDDPISTFNSKPFRPVPKKGK